MVVYGHNKEGRREMYYLCNPLLLLLGRSGREGGGREREKRQKQSFTQMSGSKGKNDLLCLREETFGVVVSRG